MNGLDLHLRGLRTAVACWAAYARTVRGGTVQHLPGVEVAVFTDGPEREFFNNAVLGHGLGPAARRRALDAMAATYAEAGITSYAAWTHESDTAMVDDLTARGLRHQETTWSMGRTLEAPVREVNGVAVDRGHWSEYLQVLELPPGLLVDADPDDFDVAVGRLEGRAVATGMGFDHDGDCGIYNVGTVAQARGRGLGAAVVARLLRGAVGRGATTATLQATEMARGVYASEGFTHLGRILEFGPPGRSA